MEGARIIALSARDDQKKEVRVMVFKRLFARIKKKKEERKKIKTDKKVSKSKSKKKKSADNDGYSNRFLKFYHLNKKRLNKERRGTYSDKKKKGICVRCNQTAVSGIVFCKVHQEMQKGYNKKARSK